MQKPTKINTDCCLNLLLEDVLVDYTDAMYAHLF